MEEIDISIVEDIKKTINYIRNTINSLQKFSVNVEYFNIVSGVPKRDNSVVSIEKWIEVQHVLMREKLFVEAAQNGLSYATAHQMNTRDLEHWMDKLMLSINQLEMAFSVRPKAIQNYMEEIDPANRPDAEVVDNFIELGDFIQEHESKNNVAVAGDGSSDSLIEIPDPDIASVKKVAEPVDLPTEDVSDDEGGAVKGSPMSIPDDD